MSVDAAASIDRAVSDGVAPRTLLSAGVTCLLAAAIVVAFRIGGTRRPDHIEVLLIVATCALLPLVDSATLRHIPVSLTLASLWVWMVASYAWSADPPGWSQTLTTHLAPMVTLFVLLGVCRLDAFFTVVLWVVRATVVACLVAVVVLPQARMWVDPNGRAPDLAGWRGVFSHKNQMGPFLSVAAVTVLCFDGRRATRWLSLATIGVLLIGSRSLTGVSVTIAAAMVVSAIRMRHRFPTVRRRWWLLAGCGVAAALVFVALSRFELFGQDRTITGRTDIWRAVLVAWSDRPWSGYGMSSVLRYERPSALTESIWRDIGFEVVHAHNGVLDVGLQLGLIGAGIVVAIAVGAVVDAVRLVSVDPRIAGWSMAMVTAQVLTSITEDALLGNVWVGGLVIVRMVELRRLRLPAGDVTGSTFAFCGGD